MDKLVERFRSDLEPYQRDHCGHSITVMDRVVRFEGDSWEVSHEAYLFKQWLESNGYVAVFADPHKQSIAIVEPVDTPSWLDVQYVDDTTIRLQAMNETMYSDVQSIDTAIESFRQQLWTTVADVSGVGNIALQSLANTFETPMHGLGRFEEADGIGSSTAAALDSFVGNRL